MTPEAALRHLMDGIPASDATSAGVLQLLRTGPVSRSWLVETAGQRGVLRVDNPVARELGLNRAAESGVLEAAAAAGLGPAPVACDPAQGLLLRQYLEGNALRPADLQEPATRRGVARLLRHLHATPFAGRVLDLEVAIGRYAQLAGPGARELVTTTHRLLDACRDPQAKLCFCHNDPVVENIVAGTPAGKLWLIDWEYAGLNEPWFDLAVVAWLDPGLAGPLLADYLGRPPSGEELNRLEAWSAFHTSLARLWDRALGAGADGVAQKG